jgi:hypothetical protein
VYTKSSAPSEPQGSYFGLQKWARWQFPGSGHGLHSQSLSGRVPKHFSAHWHHSSGQETADIQRKGDEIGAFAEIEKINSRHPVKRYSRGMFHSRLVSFFFFMVSLLTWFFLPSSTRGSRSGLVRRGPSFF